MQSKNDPEGSCSSCSAAAADAADAGGAGLAAPHYWEEEIFRGNELSAECRDGLVYYGLIGRPPMLLAGVEGRDHEGRPFQWLARRQRKQLAHPHRCPAPPPPIDWLGWLDARKHWRKLGWWIAVLYTLGSTLFVVNGVAGEVAAVGAAQGTPGAGSLPAGLIGWPNAVAANLCFMPAGIIQVVEVCNMDFGGRRRVWEKGGHQGPPPRRRLRPRRHDLRTVSLWAALIQLSGMAGFNVATIAMLASYAVELKPAAERWLVNFGFTYGGAAFTASSILFAWEATSSWWRGLVPARCADLRALSWHAAFWGWQGSVGFLIGGAATYASSFSWTQAQWIAGVGNLGGAIWFLLSALAAGLEQGNPNHP